jgi:RHS repeat-associated protein
MTDAAGAIFIYKHPGNRAEGMTGPTGSATPVLSNAMDVSSYTDQAGATWSATYDGRGNMVTRTAPAPLSYVESWTYDAKNNPLTYVDAKGITTTYTYDTTGRLLTTSRPAPVGNAVTTNVWNANGTLLSSTDPRGATTTFAYDLNGNMLSSTDALGNKTTYTYDTAGRVLTMVEPRGNVSGGTPSLYTTTYTYDGNGNVLTVKDALGRITTRAYDNAGNLSSITAPDTGITTYAYNAANELLSQTAPDGGITSYEYSNRGQRTKQTDPTGGITTWTYDAAGRMITMVEPRGNVSGATAALFTTTYGYDAVGRQTSITDPAGRVTTTVYDVLGRVATRTDPQGTTTFAYDGNGNVLSTARTGIGTSSSTYDSLNRVATAIDPRGKTTTYTYDLGGNLTLLTSPLGFKTSYTYDTVGRKATMVDPRGNVSGGTPANFTTTYEYDASGNQIGVTNQLGQKTISTFSQTGTVASVKDPKLNTTTFAYDPMDRVNGVTAPASGTTSYAYNTAGRLTARTDSKTHVTNYLYDLSGRLTKQTDPLGRFRTFTYDAAGNQTKMVNARANAAANPLLGSTTVTFDTSGRPTLTDYSDTTPDVGLVYDSIGRISSMTDGAGTETYGYDSAGRLTTVTRGTATYTYAYDNNGNVTSRTYPDGTVTTYAYDDENRLSTVTTATKVTTYIYDVAGNLISIQFPGGGSQNNFYDRAGRVSNLNHSLGGSPEFIYTYTRDLNGLPTKIEAGATTPVLASLTETKQLTYDTANRLTSVCYGSGVCPTSATTTWTYDTVGNRTTEQIGTGAPTTYTYDNADQLISAGSTGYTYDEDGNQTLGGPQITSYNAAGQIKRTKFGALTPIDYTYDGRGNRLTSTSSPFTTRFSWDINNPLPMLATESDTAGSLIRRYTYGKGILSMSTATATSYYRTDGLGNIVFLSKPITQVAGGLPSAFQWAYAYDPFGQTKTASKIDPLVADNPFQFASEYEQNGSYNLRARRYVPTQGRFTQTDPMPLGAGSVYESAYAYAGNNPAVYVDPSGMRKAKTAGEKLVRKNCGLIKDFCRRTGVNPGVVAKILMEENNFSSFVGDLASTAETMDPFGDPRTGVSNLHTWDLASVVPGFGVANTRAALGDDYERAVNQNIGPDIGNGQRNYILDKENSRVTAWSQDDDRLNVKILILRLRLTKLDLDRRPAAGPLTPNDALILSRKAGPDAAIGLYRGNLRRYQSGLVQSGYAGDSRFQASATKSPAWLQRYAKYDPLSFLQC